MQAPFAQDPANSMAGWYFSPETIEDSLVHRQMLNASIDLTNACNLNCPYCYIEEKNSRRKTRKATELCHQETIDVIADLLACGARTINIVGAGEPTIDAHFEETIEYISCHGMVPVVFTNGILLARDDRLLSFLYRHHATVVLKYDSISRSLQDLVAGRSGYADKRDLALERLIDAGFCAEIPTRLGIDTVVFKGNIGEVAGIHRWARERNIFPIAAEFIPTGRTAGGSFCGFGALETFPDEVRQTVLQVLQPVSRSDRTSTVSKLVSLDAMLGVGRAESFAYYGGGSCTQQLGLYIDIEGRIWPCVARKQVVNGTLLEQPLGNVRDGDRPSNVWKTHSYLAEVRTSFTGGCPYKTSFNAQL